MKGLLLKNKFVKYIYLVVLIASFIGLWIYSFDKSEVVECYKLESQASAYSATFYLLDWQKAQCDSHNIIIDAPVRAEK